MEDVWLTKAAMPAYSRYHSCHAISRTYHGRLHLCVVPGPFRIDADPPWVLAYRQRLHLRLDRRFVETKKRRGQRIGLAVQVPLASLKKSLERAVDPTHRREASPGYEFAYTTCTKNQFSFLCSSIKTLKFKNDNKVQ